MSQRLQELRTRIAAIDAEILRLAADRLKIVQQVGAVKREEGVAVRSFAAEAEVLERFRRLAGEYGLDEHFAEKLALQLISVSVRLQEDELSERTVLAKRILIVGGAGKMGRWLARFFANQGHQVVTFDRKGAVDEFETADALVPAVQQADVVLIATPLVEGKLVLHEILSQQPAALVVDIFSLKSHVLELLQTSATNGLRVASVHPLFGPNVQTLSGRVIVVCDCGNASAAAEAEALFRETALAITRLPVAEHDEYMQYVLGLSHLASILFFTTLHESGRGFNDLVRTASTTFYKQARAAAEVARENPYLYYEIQHLNRHSAELFDLLNRSLAKLQAAVLSDDPATFVALMTAGRDYFPETLPAELG